MAVSHIQPYPERSHIVRRYENEDDFVSPQELYGTGNALDYKYQGPFNRVDPCLQEVEDGKGIKVQLTQEAKVV